MLKFKRTQFLKFITPWFFIPLLSVSYYNVMKDICIMTRLHCYYDPPPFSCGPRVRYLCAASVASPAPHSASHECGEGGVGRAVPGTAHRPRTRGAPILRRGMRSLEIQCHYSMVETEYFKLLLLILVG